MDINLPRPKADLRKESQKDSEKTMLTHKVLVSYYIDYIVMIKYKFGVSSNDSFTALLC